MDEQYYYVVMHLDHTRGDLVDAVTPVKVFMFSDYAYEYATQENEDGSENDFYYVIKTPIGCGE